MRRITLVPEPGSKYYRAQFQGFVGRKKSYMTTFAYKGKKPKPKTPLQIRKVLQTQFPNSDVTVESEKKPKHPAIRNL